MLMIFEECGVKKKKNKESVSEMYMFLLKATTDTSLYRSLRRTSPPLYRLFYLLVETTFNEVSE